MAKRSRRAAIAACFVFIQVALDFPGEDKLSRLHILPTIAEMNGNCKDLGVAPPVNNFNGRQSMEEARECSALGLSSYYTLAARGAKFALLKATVVELHS